MADDRATPDAWLDAGARQTASDIALGCVLLVAAAVAYFGAGDMPSGRGVQLGPGFFPSLVGGLLLATGVVLLIRSIVFGTAPPVRWSLRELAIIVVAIAASYWAATMWGHDLLLQFGPSEFVALIVFMLTVGIALARRSRVRAAGMALLGLLLTVVGLDVSTGVARLTMGLEGLFEGIAPPILLLGLIVIADGALCLISPSLMLATYVRQVAGWTAPRLPKIAEWGMRFVAVLAIAAACYYVFELNRALWDIGVLFVFGVACKLYGCNRLVLLLAFTYGNLLEESIRRSMLISRGDPAVFLERPFSGALLLLAFGVFAVTVALTVRSALIRKRLGSEQA